MPAGFPQGARALALAAAVLMGAQLPAAHAADAAPVTNSELDAPLFYQLLIGEIGLREGDAGTAYQVMLAAAHRTKDEALFQRATEIALQARAGEQALAAVRAWREAVPSSLGAHRYLVQLLAALNRLPETVEPLRSMIELTPAAERGALIANLPRFFARSPDRRAAAQLVEDVLRPYAESPATRVAVTVAQGRAWLAAGDVPRAHRLAREAHALDPASEGPALLALELMGEDPTAEALVTAHLQAAPASNAVRSLYARVLTGSQRYADAQAQLEAVTAAAPDTASAWLTLGALHLEMRRPAQATQALQRYVELAQAQEAATPADTESPARAALAAAREQGLTQAWLMLAQAAEQQQDDAAAEAWLARIDDASQAIQVQARRASLMARKGRLDEARELIRKVPERRPGDARTKALAEVGLLREMKQWQAAYDVLAAAVERSPDDAGLLYEQSMVAEKLDRIDEMERLLRRVIELEPDHFHAHNALGYSLADRNMRLPEAKALILKALELSPGEPFITDSLGWVEYRMGNRDEALRHLRAAYRSRPDPEIAAHLGEVLWVSGQQEEARRVWREARTRDATNEVLRETLARLRVDDL